MLAYMGKSSYLCSREKGNHMLNINQMTMTKEYWCVIRNNEEGVYFIVFKDFVKKGYLKKTVKESSLQLLADDDQTARQIIEDFALAKILDYDTLLSSSDKYVYVPTTKSEWFEWLVVEK